MFEEAQKDAIQNLPIHLRRRDPSLLRDIYASTYGKDLVCRFATRDPSDFVSTIQFAKQQYLRTLDQVLSSKPWQPLKIGETEYNSHYKGEKEATQPDPKHPAVASTCRSCQLGRDEQPIIQPMLHSIAKHLDPYISTTKLMLTQISEADRRGIAANDCITYYNSKGFGHDYSIKFEKPHDKFPFEYWPRLTLVPPLVEHVPNKGLKSEVQAKYVHPLHQGLTDKWTVALESPFKLIPSTPGKFMAVPNSYQTEYIHLGNVKHVRSTIDLGSSSIREKIH